MNVQDDPPGESEDGRCIEAMDLQRRMEYLQDLDIPPDLPPIEALLLAIMRQSVVDYFGDDPEQQLGSALYFAFSPLYREVLLRFNLPEDLLPLGVDLGEFRRKRGMNEDYQLDRLHLETLIRQLSGTQVKVLMMMRLIELPATTRTISLRCGMSRKTVLDTLQQLSTQGLVRRDGEFRPEWSLPLPVCRLIDELAQTNLNPLEGS